MAPTVQSGWRDSQGAANLWRINGSSVASSFDGGAPARGGLESHAVDRRFGQCTNRISARIVEAAVRSSSAVLAACSCLGAECAPDRSRSLPVVLTRIVFFCDLRIRLHDAARETALRGKRAGNSGFYACAEPEVVQPSLFRPGFVRLLLLTPTKLG
jgi:hypothetical protein